MGKIEKLIFPTLVIPNQYLRRYFQFFIELSDHGKTYFFSYKSKT
jgi:hypothetical protein